MYFNSSFSILFAAWKYTYKKKKMPRMEAGNLATPTPRKLHKDHEITFHMFQRFRLKTTICKLQETSLFSPSIMTT